MQITKSTKPTLRTWLGRAGLETTHHFDSKPYGLRMSVIEWQDDGTTQYRLIKGDGRSRDFQELMNVTL